jgi:hypothetical protein
VSLSRPTPEELAYGHVCPPSQRNALLTRSVLALLAVEDLRSAAILVRSYLSEIENVPGPTGGGRSNNELKAGYLDKTDGVAPSHAIFCSMLVRICEKDTKTAPLFTWLVRNFGQELGTMHDPEAVRAYTMKIGRVYFDIQLPPSDDGEHDVRHGGGGGDAWRDESRGDDAGHAGYAGRRDVRAANLFLRGEGRRFWRNGGGATRGLLGAVCTSITVAASIPLYLQLHIVFRMRCRC